MLLPFGAADRLLDISGIDWVIARTEEQLPLPITDERRSNRPGLDEWWPGDDGPVDAPDGVGAVVTDLRASLPAAWERFIAHCALKGISVYHSKDVSELITGSVEIEHLSENTFGSLLPNSVYMRLKTFVDVIAALVIAPVAIAVCAIAAIAIKLDDRGPVLFLQERMGHRGEPFTMFKLRTMRVADAPGRPFTAADDDRITRVGRFLRKYRIDELPQIINILRGEMSWIGPRPESMPLSEWYGSKIPFYSYRHIVKPGITGWAQVHQGNVAEIEAATGKLNYDFFYIKNFSPWLDLLISAKTVRIMLTGFGAR